MKKDKDVVYVNEFGVTQYIDRSSKPALRERVRLLKQVIKTGCPVESKKPLSKKDVERAKMHLGWYAAILNKLEGKKPAAKGSKKKSSTKAS